MMRAAPNFPLLQNSPGPITVTQQETDRIGRLRPNRHRLKRLLFAFLCFAKYYDSINHQNNSWANAAWRKVFRAAEVTATVEAQCAMIAELKNEGLIELSRRVDSLNVRVAFVDKYGAPLILVPNPHEAGKIWRSI
jgi:hypothetical protein